MAQAQINTWALLPSDDIYIRGVAVNYFTFTYGLTCRYLGSSHLRRRLNKYWKLEYGLSFIVFIILGCLIKNQQRSKKKASAILQAFFLCVKE